ncbi:hypothetical protein DPEC_G00150330 [Dallia pectoralis]|uniref:Uncharacterized protein n=1 Tax=Dallia pectoralis TaxID=75939 RepID=A0ACC2GJD0_DALPE|nr:hypothetical protein DPEC_G00150330 [Dallia pectoralis]
MQYFFLLLLVEVFSTSNGTPCEKGCKCRETLKLTTCADARFTQLPAHIPPYTEHLELSGNRLTFLPQSSFQVERKLRVLLLNNNNISDVADGAFAQLEVLQKLDLSMNSDRTQLQCRSHICEIANQIHCGSICKIRLNRLCVWSPLSTDKVVVNLS